MEENRKGSIEVKCKDILPKNVLYELNDTGDSRIEWDPDEFNEVRAPKDMFKKLIAIPGMKAYRVGKGGRFDEEIKTFDKNAGEIVMVPQIAGG